MGPTARARRAEGQGFSRALTKKVLEEWVSRHRDLVAAVKTAGRIVLMSRTMREAKRDYLKPPGMGWITHILVHVKLFGRLEEEPG